MSNEEGSSSNYPASSVDQVTEHLLICVQNSKDNVKFSPIYKVPSILRDVNPSSFTPRVVSIGPFHKGHANLKSVENKKPTYLFELLSKQQVGSLDQTLNKCVERVRGSIEDIKNSYFELKMSYSDDIDHENELVQMMVMDACYILRFLDNITKPSEAGNLFSNNRLRSRNIALDLVLLENQIPFFVLQNIYDLTIKNLQGIPTLADMLCVLLEFINPFITQPELQLNVNHVDTSKTTHILDFLHQLYKPNFKLPKIEEIPTGHSAVELDKVGVKIRPNKNLTANYWPMDMQFENSKFRYKPTLKMPEVRIDNFFEVVLRNLIAYEQYSPVDNYFTSYAMAMHMLIATSQDIAKLGKSGVIVSHLGSNEKASDMISSICKNVNLQDFYYIQTWKDIGEYYDSFWPRIYGEFKRTYISTPWKVIALLVAIIVFLITVAQFLRQIIMPFL